MTGEIRERHAEESLKLHGLVMTAAAAGIGFAFHETADRAWDWSLVAALLAVVLWALSFASGIWSRQAVMQAMNSNALYLEALSARQLDGAKISKEFMAKHSRKAAWLRDAQLWLLVIGALVYMGSHVWHVAEVRPAETATPVAQEISVETRFAELRNEIAAVRAELEVRTASTADLLNQAGLGEGKQDVSQKVRPNAPEPETRR